MTDYAKLNDPQLIKELRAVAFRIWLLPGLAGLRELLLVSAVALEKHNKSK